MFSAGFEFCMLHVQVGLVVMFSLWFGFSVALRVCMKQLLHDNLICILTTTFLLLLMLMFLQELQ